MTPSDMSTMTPTQHQVNATREDTVQLEMVKILQQIRQKLLTKNGQQGTNTNINNNNHGQHRGPRKILTMLPLIETKRINTFGRMVDVITLSLSAI